MNLHHLQITAMGPFAGTETVDFDRLSEAGVFLLTGRTGSGKTTVLDAVSYAIFGSIPRNATGGDVVSHHRKPEVSPQVVLEATIAGERLRITRSPRHERPARRGSGTATEDQSLLVEHHSGGEWSELTGRWREGNELLQERIGMNSDQFNQVVMLPQGQFEKFLDASADDRRKLLQQLFPGTDLEWLEQWLKREATAAREERDRNLERISNHFQRVLPIARKLISESEDPELIENPLPGHTEAGPAIRWIEETRGKLEAIAGQREQERAEAHQAWDDAASELQVLRKRADLVRQRRTADLKLISLNEKLEWRQETGDRIQAARRAATVKAHATTAAARRQEQQRASAKLDELKPQLGNSPLIAGVPDEQLEEHREQLRAGLLEISDFIRDELPKREGLERQTKELETELEGLTATGPESQTGKAKLLVEAKTKAAAEAIRSYVEIRDTRTRGMARELAGKLKDGIPCPVCGSPDHPAPAEGADEVPSEADEKAAEDIRNRARESESAALRSLGETEQKVAARRATVETNLATYRQTLKELREREVELGAGDPEIRHRATRLENAIDLLDRYLAADRALQTASRAADQAASEAAREAETQGFGSVETALAAAIERDQLDQLQEETEEFDQQLRIVENSLAGELSAVNPAEVIDLDPAIAAEKAASGTRDQATRESGTADRDRDTFRQETDPIPGLYAELLPLRETADRISELDRLASGKNERNMRLSIFFLATRLQQVIEAANHRLAEMTDQRYTLVYSGELAGHGAASGLGINVHDSHTSESRPTGTLSGGEKFCAALSLALGLAEVVQTEADGKSLETLFIDEGFGTLDTQSLEQVMTVIDSLREGGRSVGLVSHVEDLRNRITAQIQVTPSREGSTLKVTTG